MLKLKKFLINLMIKKTNKNDINLIFIEKNIFNNYNFIKKFVIKWTFILINWQKRILNTII